MSNARDELAKEMETSAATRLSDHFTEGDRELLRKGAAMIRQCDGEARALEDALVGVREELGIESGSLLAGTHYFIMYRQVADVIRLFKYACRQLSRCSPLDANSEELELEIVWGEKSAYDEVGLRGQLPQLKITGGYDPRARLMSCPPETKEGK